MIKATRITKRFGRFTALKDVSFAIATGEAVALWGPNGAGKTTAIRCVLGLLRYEGRIEIHGVDARKNPKAARRVLGYVPQELCLHDDMKALEALHFYARLKRVERNRPATVLAEVGLDAHGRKRIGELSGGMKQRLALAIALLANPRVLVLDELTSNLDSAAQSSFMALLRTLKNQHGKTILFTSHHLDEIETLADRVLVLEEGQLKQESAPLELAKSLGLRSVLKLIVADGWMQPAIDTLRQHGLVASANGRGVLVEVPLREKAIAIHMLTQASIEVRDFEYVGEVSTREAGGVHVA